MPYHSVSNDNVSIVMLYHSYVYVVWTVIIIIAMIIHYYSVDNDNGAIE